MQARAPCPPRSSTSTPGWLLLLPVLLVEDQALGTRHCRDIACQAVPGCCRPCHGARASQTLTGTPNGVFRRRVIQPQTAGPAHLAAVYLLAWVGALLGTYLGGAYIGETYTSWDSAGADYQNQFYWKARMCRPAGQGMLGLGRAGGRAPGGQQELRHGQQWAGKNGFGRMAVMHVSSRALVSTVHVLCGLRV